MALRNAFLNTFFIFRFYRNWSEILVFGNSEQITLLSSPVNRGEKFAKVQQKSIELKIGILIADDMIKY